MEAFAKWYLDIGYLIVTALAFPAGIWAGMKDDEYPIRLFILIGIITTLGITAVIFNPRGV